MEREHALQTLHAALPPDAGFTLRWCQDTHSVEDFSHSPPPRTGRYATKEHWTVTVQCRRPERYYLEAAKHPTLAAAVGEALQQFAAWERGAQKPPKLTAPPSGNEVKQREAM